jgi:hypothetical protein
MLLHPAAVAALSAPVTVIPTPLPTTLPAARPVGDGGGATLVGAYPYYASAASGFFPFAAAPYTPLYGQAPAASAAALSADTHAALHMLYDAARQTPQPDPAHHADATAAASTASAARRHAPGTGRPQPAHQSTDASASAVLAATSASAAAAASAALAGLESSAFFAPSWSTPLPGSAWTPARTTPAPPTKRAVRAARQAVLQARAAAATAAAAAAAAPATGRPERSAELHQNDGDNKGDDNDEYDEVDGGAGDDEVVSDDDEEDLGQEEGEEHGPDNEPRAGPQQPGARASSIPPSYAAQVQWAGAAHPWMHPLYAQAAALGAYRPLMAAPRPPLPPSSPSLHATGAAAPSAAGKRVRARTWTTNKARGFDETAQLIANALFRRPRHPAPTLEGTDAGVVMHSPYCGPNNEQKFEQPYDHCRFIAESILTDANDLLADLNAMVVQVNTVLPTPLRTARRPDEVAKLALFRARQRIALYLQSEVKPVAEQLAQALQALRAPGIDDWLHRVEQYNRRIASLVSLSRARHIICKHSSATRSKRLSTKVHVDSGPVPTTAPPPPVAAARGIATPVVFSASTSAAPAPAPTPAPAPAFAPVSAAGSFTPRPMFTPMAMASTSSAAFAAALGPTALAQATAAGRPPVQFTGMAIVSRGRVTPVPVGVSVTAPRPSRMARAPPPQGTPTSGPHPF